ncbi:MAG: 4Fe-4S binding protein [Myxococcales bacterium]|nr:4Fe-4S binding protein [Myxococcales bacterium]MCB9522925.1 4Fe-4S binding protein [Myxococcales bacterium]
MRVLTASLRAMGVTLRNLFRTPTTVEYPDVIRPRSERHRVSFALVHDEHGEEACIGCMACERICPSTVITVVPDAKRESPVTGKKRGYLKDFTLDLQACIVCELCVQVCPTDAILMTREPETPGFTREDLVLTMDKLYANEKAKTVTWGNATKLNEMQDPKRGLVEPEAEAPAEKPVARPRPKAEAAATPARDATKRAEPGAADAVKAAVKAQAPEGEAPVRKPKAKPLPAADLAAGAAPAEVVAEAKADAKAEAEPAPDAPKPTEGDA